MKKSASKSQTVVLKPGQNEIKCVGGKWVAGVKRNPSDYVSIDVNGYVSTRESSNGKERAPWIVLSANQAIKVIQQLNDLGFYA